MKDGGRWEKEQDFEEDEEEEKMMGPAHTLSSKVPISERLAAEATLPDQGIVGFASAVCAGKIYHLLAKQLIIDLPEDIVVLERRSRPGFCLAPKKVVNQT